MRQPNQPPRNHPDAEKAIVGLWMVKEAAVDYLESHGPACTCIMCEDMAGVLFNVRNLATLIADQSFTLPSHLRRLEQEGFPSADDLAVMLHYFKKREEEQEAEMRQEAEEAWRREDERHLDDGAQPAA